MKRLKIQTAQLFITFAYLLCLSGSLLAESADDKIFGTYCETKRSTTPFVEEVYKQSKEIVSDYCNLVTASKVEIKDKLLSIINNLEIILGADSPTTWAIYDEQKTLFDNSNTLTPFSVGDDGGTHLLTSNLHTLSATELQHCDDYAQEIKAGASCLEALTAFKVAYDYALSVLTKNDLKKLHNKIKAYTGYWNEFSENSKAQTYLELALNGFIYDKKNSGVRFNKPPSHQWVFMHPSLVSEHVHSAQSGEKEKRGLMLEILGVDYWKQDNWYLPTGGSFVAMNFERTNMPDTRLGLSLTFKHKYLLGFTTNSNHDNGVFISWNLLKSVEDVKEKLRDFKNMAN